jgi:hypothetical protein
MGGEGIVKAYWISEKFFGGIVLEYQLGWKKIVTLNYR